MMAQPVVGASFGALSTNISDGPQFATLTPLASSGPRYAALSSAPALSTGGATLGSTLATGGSAAASRPPAAAVGSPAATSAAVPGSGARATVERIDPKDLTMGLDLNNDGHINQLMQGPLGVDVDNDGTIDLVITPEQLRAFIEQQRAAARAKAATRPAKVLGVYPTPASPSSSQQPPAPSFSPLASQPIGEPAAGAPSPPRTDPSLATRIIPGAAPGSPGAPGVPGSSSAYVQVMPQSATITARPPPTMTAYAAATAPAPSSWPGPMAPPQPSPAAWPQPTGPSPSPASVVVAPPQRLVVQNISVPGIQPAVVVGPPPMYATGYGPPTPPMSTAPMGEPLPRSAPMPAAVRSVQMEPRPAEQPQPEVIEVEEVIEKPVTYRRVVEVPIPQEHFVERRKAPQWVEGRDHPFKDPPVRITMKETKLHVYDSTFFYHDPVPECGCDLTGHVRPPTSENPWLSIYD